MRSPVPRTSRSRRAAAVAALLLPAAAWAGPARVPHATLGEGVPADRDQVRGSCIVCHGRPAQLRARTARPGEDPCVACHAALGARGSFQGPVAYEQSSHGPRSLAVWPGPRPARRPVRDAGRCVNCHTAHGARDASGLVPDLLVARGEALCLACHGAGSRLDVATALAKPHRHPAAGRGPSTSPGGRTATCADCHNPHVSGETPRGVPAPEALGAQQGVARVRVANGPAGTSPVLNAVSAADRSRAFEYEVCLRCHSTATPLPAGSPDLGLLLNPANPSFHPVQARGKNPRIDRRAFAAGWSAEAMVRCTDCHGGDSDDDRGVHGSAWEGLLRRRHVAGPGFDLPRREDLCFGCHAYESYAEPSSATRFGAHAAHASAGAGCWACHDAHGSPGLPALVALRSPGMRSYAQTPTGGTCTVSCHLRAPATASYALAYPR